MPRERVSVEAVEHLLAAFMREFHKVRQRHHGIPGWIGYHLNREALRLQSVRFAGLQQAGEIERLRLRAANRQRQGFDYERAPREHGQETLLAIGEPIRRAYSLVAERLRAVGDFELP